MDFMLIALSNNDCLLIVGVEILELKLAIIHKVHVRITDKAE